MTTLRPPRHAPDPRAVACWTAERLILTAVLAAVVVPAYWFLTDRPLWLGAVTAAVLLACCAMSVIGPRMLYRFQRWEVTEEAVYTRTGWLERVWRVAPMSRIQTVDTRRGPLQNLFGLADVKVTTASSAGAITLHALDAAQAAELAERLTAITQATPGDAT
ncbi:PH domain-containing protein [Nonomuraea sp. NPDC050310]|uniref:PH domain-containing protein n=1 Tax=Nonomuraea sp. NPDC050310 TaxID=3154935 RepID=UPI0033F62A68